MATGRAIFGTASTPMLMFSKLQWLCFDLGFYSTKHKVTQKHHSPPTRAISSRFTMTGSFPLCEMISFFTKSGISDAIQGPSYTEGNTVRTFRTTEDENRRRKITTYPKCKSMSNTKFRRHLLPKWLEVDS